MAKAKAPKYATVANPEMHKAMCELRRSSAASTHDNRPKRQRSRANTKRASINSGW